MRNIFILLRTYFKAFVGRLTRNKKNKSTYFGAIILLLVSVMMVFIFTTNAITTMTTFLGDEYPADAYQLSMFTNCSFALLMLVFVTLLRCITPQKSRDTELLLPFPIKRSQIVISKNIYNYIFDLSLFAMILLPGYIVYYIMAPVASIGIVFRGILLIFVFPLFSNALSCFIGEFFNKLSEKLKYYSIFQAIFSFLLIGFYLVFNYIIQGYLQKVSGTVVEIRNKIFFVREMLEYLLDNKWLFFIVLSLVSIVLYGLSVLYLSRKIGKVEKKNSLKSNKMIFKKRSIFQSLLLKELKQYFSMPVYIINTAIPGILYIGMSVAVLIIGKENTFLFLNNFKIFDDNNLLLLMVFSILIGFFVITGSSISLEGNKIWILASNPIKTKDIFAAKVCCNLVITMVVILVSFPIILTFVDLKVCWYFLLVPMLSTIASSILGLIINLKLPKLTWDREEVVIKQSMASLLSLTLPLFVIAIPFVVFAIIFGYSSLIAVLLISLYLLIVILLEILWLKYRGTKSLYHAILHN